MFLSPAEAIPECVAAIPDLDAFYDMRHQVIFDALRRRFDRGEAVDVITAQESLKDSGHLDMIGGIAYLSALQDVVPSAANLPYYLAIMRDKWVLRRAIRACTEVVARVHDFEGDVDALMDEVERDILAITALREAGADRVGIKELVRRALAAIDDRYARGTDVTGIASGFPDLDRLTAGWQPKEMTVVAGLPSVGKTAFALCCASHAALRIGVPTAVFTLEMSREKLVERVVCAEARVNGRRPREWCQADLERATTAASLVGSSGLVVEEAFGASILELRARARRLASREGVRLFVIDYLQLVGAPERRGQNREQEVSAVSKGIRAMAGETGAHVIVLSQVNDDGAIRESRAASQDGDNVVRLKAESDEDGDAREDLGDGPMAVDLLLQKQRNGPTGKVRLVFVRQHTRYESAARVSDEEAGR